MHLGTAQSWVVDNWEYYRRKPGATPEGFRLFRKDVGLALEFARDLGHSLPGAMLAQQHIDGVLGVSDDPSEDQN